MKELNITFNFLVPNEEYNHCGAYDLANYIIDCIWDEFHQMNYKLQNYVIETKEVNSIEGDEDGKK